MEGGRGWRKMEGGEDKGVERGGMNLVDAVINSRTAQSQGGKQLERERARHLLYGGNLC